jgi:hypothetical protein
MHSDTCLCRDEAYYPCRGFSVLDRDSGTPWRGKPAMAHYPGPGEGTQMYKK